MSPRPVFPANAETVPDGARLRGLIAVNGVSTLAQIVQIGAIAPLLSFVLSARGVEPGAIGVFSTAPWLMILAVSRTVPRLIARLGLVASVGGSVVLSAGAIALMPVVESIWALFVLNLVVGFGLIVRWIACDTWIVRIASDAGRGRAIGIHETMMGLGIAIGPMLLALVGVEGWPPFALCVGLLLAGLIPLAATRGWDGKPGVPADARSGRALVGLLATALTAAFVCGFVETASIALLPVYAGGLGLAAAAGALLVGAFGTGGTVLQMPLGWLADAIGFRRSQILCAAVILLGAGAVPATFALAGEAAGLPWILLPWIVLFVWGGAVGGLNTLAVIEAGARVDAERTSAAMTLIALAYTLGSIAGPAASGVAIERVSVHGLMITAGVMATAFLLLGLVTGRRGAADEAEERATGGSGGGGADD
ncbi:MAG: MFS transporter [Azospirillaceae bacterium]